MAHLLKAATYLVESISVKNMVAFHTIQAIIQLLPLLANGFPDSFIKDFYVHNCITLHITANIRR